MIYFNDEDVFYIESTPYNPILKPRFDAIKNCLIWDDEIPLSLTMDGYEKLCLLWIARFFMFHSKLPEEKWWLMNKELYINAWNLAINSNIKWNGFIRLILSKEDEDFLFDAMEREID